MFDEMIANAENFTQSLGIPYRVVNIVSGVWCIMLCDFTWLYMLAWMTLSEKTTTDVHFLCVYVCACVSVHVYVRMPVCVHAYLCACVCVCECLPAFVHVLIFLSCFLFTDCFKRKKLWTVSLCLLRWAQQCSSKETWPWSLVPGVSSLPRAGLMFKLYGLPVTSTAHPLWPDQEDGTGGKVAVSM